MPVPRASVVYFLKNHGYEQNAVQILFLRNELLALQGRSPGRIDTLLQTARPVLLYKAIEDHIRVIKKHKPLTETGLFTVNDIHLLALAIFITTGKREVPEELYAA
jgi:hypothetical protein